MIFAIAAMVFLTIAVGLVTFVIRVKSVRSGKVAARDYKLMDAASFPADVTKATRCFNNQFEIPVLFYVAGLASIALNVTEPLLIYLAWAFVVSRVIHAIVHLTSNHLLHRIIAFWSGVLLVCALWVVLLATLS